MTKSTLRTVGSFVGKTGAYAVHGTKLGASHFAQGVREGYASKAEELKARRMALMAEQMAPEPVVEPRTTRQRKLATAK